MMHTLVYAQVLPCLMNTLVYEQVFTSLLQILVYTEGCNCLIHRQGIYSLNHNLLPLL